MGAMSDNKTQTPPKTTEAPRSAPRIELPFDQWAQIARDNLSRLQSQINAYWDELAGYENAMYERARAATTDLAALAQESIAYASAMTAEWRKMSVEATRRVAETFGKA